MYFGVNHLNGGTALFGKKILREEFSD